MKICGSLLVLLLSLASPVFASTWIVNSQRDATDLNPGDRACWTGTMLADGTRECTLRAAVMESNYLRGGGFDFHEIRVPAGVYLLTVAEVSREGEDFLMSRGDWTASRASATGDLDLAISMRITGAGAGVTIIDGSGFDRVFEVFAEGLVRDFYVEGLTVRNGFTDLPGGCIFNRDYHTLVQLYRVSVEGCRVPAQLGGGMYNAGVAEIIQSVFRNNSAARGGALENARIATINHSLFDGNVAGGSVLGAGKGGAMSNVPGYSGEQPAIRCDSCTVSNNSANVGGALYNEGSTSFHNSTISGNVGGQVGAAYSPSPMASWTPGVSFTHSTVTGNRTTEPASSAAVSAEKGSRYSFNQSIISNNRDDDGAIVNCDGPASFSADSIEDANTCGLAGAGDQINTDPMIAPLADNGGYTPTHALLFGSPAIDAVTTSSREALDQRGHDRPFGAAKDIGSYERGIEFAATIIRIPFQWEDVFRSRLTEPIMFSVTMSLTTAQKASSPARLIGIKGADAQVKYEIVANGSVLKMTGQIAPPKQGGQGNPTLFYLDVARSVSDTAHFEAAASCDCGAKPANPVKYAIPRFKQSKSSK